MVLASDPLVEKALRYIRDHVSESINVEDVLNELGVSRPTLVHRMKHATGRMPRDAIAHMRIERAKQLLTSTDAKMEEIARQCGFRQQSHLQKSFKWIVGQTPGQYRQRHSH